VYLVARVDRCALCLLNSEFWILTFIPDPCSLAPDPSPQAPAHSPQPPDTDCDPSRKAGTKSGRGTRNSGKTWDRSVEARCAPFGALATLTSMPPCRGITVEHTPNAWAESQRRRGRSGDGGVMRLVMDIAARDHKLSRLVFVASMRCVVLDWIALAGDFA